jgi:hypothetical protein
MDKTIRRYTSLDEMKRDEYRNWQKMLPRERLDAAAELPKTWICSSVPTLRMRRRSRPR